MLLFRVYILVLTILPAADTYEIKDCPDPPNSRGNCETIAGPMDPSNATAMNEWRRAMEDWRQRIRLKTDYSGSIYEVQKLQWTQTAIIEPQMHPCKSLKAIAFYFYDQVTGN